MVTNMFAKKCILSFFCNCKKNRKNALFCKHIMYHKYLKILSINDFKGTIGFVLACRPWIKGKILAFGYSRGLKFSLFQAKFSKNMKI